MGLNQWPTPYQDVATTNWANSALILGRSWGNQTPTFSFVAKCNIHFTKDLKLGGESRIRTYDRYRMKVLLYQTKLHHHNGGPWENRTLNFWLQTRCVPISTNSPKLVWVQGFEPWTPGPKPGMLPDYTILRYKTTGWNFSFSNKSFCIAVTILKLGALGRDRTYLS